jgi:hypothetical protein
MAESLRSIELSDGNRDATTSNLRTHVNLLHRDCSHAIASMTKGAPMPAEFGSLQLTDSGAKGAKDEIPLTTLLSSLVAADKDHNGALSRGELSGYLSDLSRSAHHTHSPGHHGHRPFDHAHAHGAHPGQDGRPARPADSPRSTDANGDHGKGVFHTHEDQIIGADGKPFLARGFAMYGWDAKNPKYLDWVANDLKPNIVRIAAHPDSDSPEELQKSIDYLTKRGIVALVEDHTGYYHTSKDGSNMPSEQKLEQVARWYAQIAAANKGNSRVWFGTPNEPSGSAAATVHEEKTIYDAIRSTGNESIILLEKNYSKLGSEPIKDNPTIFGQMKNVVLDAHYYFKTKNTDESLGWALQQDRSLGLPVIIGEFGNYDSGTWTTDSFHSIVKANQQGRVGAIGWALRNDRGANPQHLVGADVMFDNSDHVTPYGKEVEDWLQSH